MIKRNNGRVVVRKSTFYFREPFLFFTFHYLSARPLSLSHTTLEFGFGDRLSLSTRSRPTFLFSLHSALFYTCFRFVSSTHLSLSLFKILPFLSRSSTRSLSISQQIAFELSFIFGSRVLIVVDWLGFLFSRVSIRV